MKAIASMLTGHCLGALEMLSVEIYNVLIGWPLSRRKCLGAFALSNTKHTGLQKYLVSRPMS